MTSTAAQALDECGRQLDAARHAHRSRQDSGIVPSTAVWRDRLASQGAAFGELGRACLEEALEAERGQDLARAESLRVHGLRLLIESQLLQGLPTLPGL